MTDFHWREASMFFWHFRIILVQSLMHPSFSNKSEIYSCYDLDVDMIGIYK